ncbi:MAG: mechanosensitive ion channel [Bacilli bacterium]
MEIFCKIIKLISIPAIYIAIGTVIYTILKNIINNFFRFKLTLKKELDKKNNTVRLLLLNILKYVIGGLVILAILPVFGINIKAILAGLGILGLVVGLAFQDLIKDFLSGITIIAEDQFTLGDIVEIGGFKGEVIFLGLKTTKLKNASGAIKIIANRNIIDLINYSLNNSIAIVDVTISADNSLDKLDKVWNKLVEELSEKLSNIKGKVKLVGIINISGASIVYRLTVETLPTKNYDVEIIMRRSIKEALEKAHIKMSNSLEVKSGN